MSEDEQAILERLEAERAARLASMPESLREMVKILHDEQRKMSVLQQFIESVVAKDMADYIMNGEKKDDI